MTTNSQNHPAIGQSIAERMPRRVERENGKNLRSADVMHNPCHPCGSCRGGIFWRTGWRTCEPIGWLGAIRLIFMQWHTHTHTHTKRCGTEDCTETLRPSTVVMVSCRWVAVVGFCASLFMHESIFASHQMEGSWKQLKKIDPSCVSRGGFVFLCLSPMLQIKTVRSSSGSGDASLLSYYDR